MISMKTCRIHKTEEPPIGGFSITILHLHDTGDCPLCHGDANLSGRQGCRPLQVLALEFRIPHLQIPSDIDRQLFFKIDQPFANVLAVLVRGLILIEVFVERLDAHVAAVRDQIGHRMIRLVHGQLDVGLDP